MTTSALTSPMTNDQQRTRAYSRWWLWPLGASLLFVVWAATIYCAGRDKVLGEATLPDGTILRLVDVTSGPNQKYFVQKQLHPLFSQFGLGPMEVSASFEAGEHFPRAGVWLTRRDPKTGEPLDLDTLSHCVAIDADGWEHPSGFIGRCHWDDPVVRTRHQETLVRDQPPFKALQPGKYREIVVGAFLPLFRAKDGRFPLQVYNSQGEIVATFDAPYPGDQPVQQNWTPVKFPASQTAADIPPTGKAGDLTVTLERIDWTRLPSDLSVPDKRLPTWKLNPVVSFHWQGAPSDDWRFISENIMAVEDGLGNMSYMDRCRLTPHVPAWKLGILILRKTDGRYETHEQWDSGPIELPPAGEFRDLDLQGQVAGNDSVNSAVHVLKVFGPGKHQFTLVEPAVLGAITPPLSHEGTGWTVSAVHRPGNVDWTVESQQPFIVWRQPGQSQGRINLFSRVFEGSDGQQIEVDDVYDSAYRNNTILTILKSMPQSGAINLKPALSDMRNAYFLISPPPAEYITGETASEVPGDR